MGSAPAGYLGKFVLPMPSATVLTSSQFLRFVEEAPEILKAACYDFASPLDTDTYIEKLVGDPEALKRCAESKGKTKEKMRLRALAKAMLAIIELKELEDTASQITFSHHDTYKTLDYRKDAAIVPWKPKRDAKITTVDQFSIFEVPPPPKPVKAAFVGISRR